MKIAESFRPGDVVRAEVVHLGDSRSVLLSTAKNELGVVFARGANGEVLVPTGWNEVASEVTGVTEPRKVAAIL